MLSAIDINRHRWRLALLPLLLVLLPVVSPGGQVLPAPIDLAGTWSLDIHLSDHPEQVARAIQFDTGEFTAEAFGRGMEPRAGEERRPPADRMSTNDRKLLAELTRPVKFPSPTLTIAQRDNAVTFTVGERAPDTLRTDGKTEKRSLDAGTFNRTAEWAGPQLLVAYEVGRAGTLTYTFSIVPTTRQLLIRVNFELVPGQPGPFEIKLVYNRAT